MVCKRSLKKVTLANFFIEDENVILSSTDSAETFDYNGCIQCLEECELNGLNLTCVLGCFMKPETHYEEKCFFRGRLEHKKNKEK
jgi:hypothetical protein